MRYLYLLALGILIVSCQDQTYDLQTINGYWEIQNANTPYGSKTYKINKSVDYFYLKTDSTGFRKKVQPSLLGKHKVTEDAETFAFVYQNDSLKIEFTSPYDQWYETVLELKEDQLILKNNANIIYIYKRFEPIEVEENER